MAPKARANSPRGGAKRSPSPAGSARASKADKPKAKKFWNGKLSHGKLKANILVGFFHLCSIYYTIYLDSVNMCT